MFAPAEIEAESQSDEDWQQRKAQDHQDACSAQGQAASFASFALFAVEDALRTLALQRDKATLANARPVSLALSAFADAVP